MAQIESIAKHFDEEQADKRESLAFYTIKRLDFKETGEEWIQKGSTYEFVQVLAAALVPVLIGIIGAFEDPVVRGYTIRVNLCIQGLAIFLSLCGTIAHSIEVVYHHRAKGQRLRECADQMEALFQRYYSHSDEFQSKEDKEAAEHNRIMSSPMTIPDLSHIPDGILEAYLRERTAAKKEPAETQAPNIAVGADKTKQLYIDGFADFCEQSNQLLKEARAAKIVGEAELQALSSTGQAV